MQLIDEKFKDASPEQTINKIEDILKSNGFSVTETPGDSGVKHCHSLHISINGTNATSNGKGASPTLARASAYAELMERLQSARFCKSGTVFSDEKFFNKEELSEYCGTYFSEISKNHPKSDGTCISDDELAEYCTLLDGGDTAKVLPFYDVINKKMTYFPYSLTKIYSTTGLAAGNSVEEAIVQGSSEIFERNSKLRIMKEKLVPPTIPEEYLMQYPEAYETIEEIKKAGYDVIIKDCSLGKPFPVLAAILINKDTHCYHVHMGCHPVFEVAIRRTLTETFQGRSLKNVTNVDVLISSAEYVATDEEIIKNMSSSSGTYPVEYFGDNYSFEFKPFADRKNSTNKELLREITDYIKSLGFSMLVRDHSSLGFDTYRIIIPGYSESRPYFLESGVATQTIKLLYDSMGEKYTSISPISASLKLKAEKQMLKLSNAWNYGRFTKSFAPDLTLPLEQNQALYYLNLAYLEWTTGDKAEALTYLKRVCKRSPDFDASYLHCLKNWICFTTNGFETDNIYSVLKPFYKTETLDEVYSAIASGNPFAKYAHDCKEINCSDCKYNSTCLIEGNTQLTNTVNKAILNFDDEASFDKLKIVFKNLI